MLVKLLLNILKKNYILFGNFGWKLFLISQIIRASIHFYYVHCRFVFAIKALTQKALFDNKIKKKKFILHETLKNKLSDVDEMFSIFLVNVFHLTLFFVKKKSLITQKFGKNKNQNVREHFTTFS